MKNQQIIEDVLSIEEGLKDIARRINGFKNISTKHGMGSYKRRHAALIKSFAEQRDLNFGDGIDRYLSEVYGLGDNPGTRGLGACMERATAEQHMVSLISHIHPELVAAYMLNSAETVPPEREGLKGWYKGHIRSSRYSIEKEIGAIADESFRLMTDAVEHGVTPTSVIEIHRANLQNFAGEWGLKMPFWRINHYIGEVYRCGLFDPSKVDDGDPKSGKLSYRQRLGVAGRMQMLLGEHYPLPESPVQRKAREMRKAVKAE